MSGQAEPVSKSGQGVHFRHSSGDPHGFPHPCSPHLPDLANLVDGIGEEIEDRGNAERRGCSFWSHLLAYVSFVGVSGHGGHHVEICLLGYPGVSPLSRVQTSEIIMFRDFC